MGGDITGDIYFFSHTIDGSPPYMDGTPSLGSAVSNFARIPTRITIHDLRGKENTVNLGTNGFEILKYDGNIHNEFDDGSEMQRQYYEDIAALLKKHLGASRVIVFNHIFRFRATPRVADRCDHTHKNPVFYPHADYDPPGARFKVEQVLSTEEVKKVMEKHFQIINVWRPVGANPITNTPLAICDYQSLDIDKDIHSSELRGIEGSVSNYVISRNAQDAQMWYYLSQMRSNEMFVFKNFDSNPNAPQFGAHTAFVNEREPRIDIEQISIEMRCLVFYD